MITIRPTDLASATVVVKVKNHSQIVEVTIPLKSFILRSEESQDDFYAAVDKALDKLESLPGLVTYNLGTGNGYSVLDMVNAFSKASGREVAYKIVDRRPGDVAMCYANPSKANEELGWEAKFGIEEMCQDAWRWQSNNPNGYRVEELELL